MSAKFTWLVIKESLYIGALIFLLPKLRSPWAILAFSCAGIATVAHAAISDLQIDYLLWRRRLRGPLPVFPSRGDQSTESSDDWECQTCRETNPSTFDACWKCSADRPTEPATEI